MSAADGKPAIWIWWLATLAAWAGVTVLRSVPLGGIWRPVEMTTALMLWGWIAAYSLGFFTGAMKQRGTIAEPVYPPANWFESWAFRLACVAALGASLIVYEFAIIRGYGFTTDVALVRISEVNAARDGFGGSAVSGAGRLMTPALIPAWIIAFLSPRPIRGRLWLLIAVATVIVLYQQMAFEGGRFFMAAFLLSVTVAYFIGQRIKLTGGARRGRFRRVRAFLLVGTITAAAIYFFGRVFVDRVNVAYPSLSAAYQTFAGNFPLIVTPEDYVRLEQGGPAAFALFMLWTYSTHAFTQFETIFSVPDLVHSLGAVQFTQITKAVGVFTGVNLTYDMFANLPKAGLYMTFPGLNYLEFGFSGLIASGLILGYLQAVSLARLGRGQMSGFGASAPVFVALAVFSPVHSLVSNLWPAIAWSLLAAWRSRTWMKMQTLENADMPPKGYPA